MEDKYDELLMQQESLKLRVKYIEDALVNLVGFYIERIDSSAQGRLRYNPNGDRATAQARTTA